MHGHMKAHMHTHAHVNTNVNPDTNKPQNLTYVVEQSSLQANLLKKMDPVHSGCEVFDD